jgi:hypothetical protein
MKHLLWILLIITTISAQADQLTLRPDAHAPIGVMADHGHKKNEWMVSHRYMSMQMDSLYNGTSKISVDSSSFMMNPTDMQMDMHMLGTMYGLSNSVTLTAMINYSNNSMTMINKMGEKSAMNSSGFNDAKLGAIFKISNSKQDQLLVNTAISLPIGSIDEKNDSDMYLPYGMQLGSGTYDISLGSTYTAYKSDYSYGAQVNGIFRLGKNKFDYALGNQYNLTTWAQKNWTNELSTSIRGTTLFITDITGESSNVSAMQLANSPLFTTEQGKVQANIGLGVNYFPKTNFLSGTRLAAELTIPVFKHTNTLNLTTDSTITFGIQRVL